MKKFTLLLISLVAVISLTACMGTNDVKNAGEDVKNNVKQGMEATKDKANDVVQSEKKMLDGVKNGRYRHGHHALGGGGTEDNRLAAA